ncbi:MAG TPA: hypothetical protein VMM56_03430 [Planctomycetaceae bacterium]|nr:hypothetical protein [Planctomycetaceae bacterium]
MTRKCVHLATKLPSFRSARESIAETIEVPLTTKRVERLTERIGETRVHQREFAIRLWERSPLMEKLAAAPPGVKPPPAACVSCDGGRIQRCDLPEQAKSHWCESKVGILLELESSRHEQDPCPELPDTFRDLAKMNTLTREIHRAAAERADPRGQVFEPPEEESPEHAPPPDPIMAELKARSAELFEQLVEALVDEGMQAGEFEIDSIRYNLIRRVMAVAAFASGTKPWTVSFKGALQTLNNLLPVLSADVSTEE